MTNGDLADGHIANNPGNCWHGNYDPKGVTSTPANIQTALTALTNVGTGNVSVTGTGPFTITADPNGGPTPDPDPTHPRTYKIGFPTQQLSGTYTVILAATIRAKAQPGQTMGDLLDTNENAGVDVLRGVNPTVATLTPISHTYSGPPVTIAPGKIISVPLNFGPENFVIGGGVMGG